MKSLSDRKKMEKKKASSFRKRFVRASGPEFVKLIADFRELSKKEQKRFSEEKDRLSEFIKLGLGEYPNELELGIISTSFTEYRKFLKRLQAEIGLAETYLTQHTEIPENVRALLWRFYHIGSPDMLDMLASD